MRRLSIALVVVSVAACRETISAPEPVVPKPTAPIVLMVSSLVAFTPSMQTAAPATAVPNAPAVMVRDQFGAPMRDVSVSFVVTDGGGFVSVTRASSGPNGVASSGRWNVGAVPGPNTLVASVAGIVSIAPVVFTAIGVIVATDGATYELTTMGGVPLPVTYSGGGSSWTYVGGRYVLAADGTFTQVYLVATADALGVIRVDSTSSLFHGTYGKISSTITFYVEGQWYAIATTSGNVLSVKYIDFDFDDELYVRSPPPASARLSPVRQAYGRRPR
jgi:hypothetical protein